MSKDVLQIIGNYLDSKDFYELKKLCNLSVDIYIKNANVKVNDHHEYMDDLIKRNLITDVDVIKYALQYDIQKYARLVYVGVFLYVFYHKAYMATSDFKMHAIPKIIKHSYKHHGFRFNQHHLDFIFENDDVELIKIVQNYPQKSNTSIEDYCARHNNTLWQLNYRHKIVHLMAKYRTCFYYLVCLLFGIFNGCALRVCCQLLGVGELNWYTLVPLCVGLGVPSVYIIIHIVKAFINLKLPL